MDATILLIGDELLAGYTRDANGHALAQRLRDLGHRVSRIVVVPDEAGIIEEELTRALARSPLVLISGGLGPTHDDRTTDVLAKHFGMGIAHDEAGWKRLVTRYAGRIGKPFDSLPAAMIENARRMVRYPDGAEPLMNPVGASTPYAIRDRDRLVVVFPGVPAECIGIFDESVSGSLIPQHTADTHEEFDVTLPESAFAADLATVAAAHPGVELGSYPHHGEPRVTVRFRGDAAAVGAARDAFLRIIPEDRIRPSRPREL